MQATITTATSAATPAVISGGRRWAGRILSGLAGLFLLVDAAVKVARLAPATEGTVRLGYPVEVTAILGFILLACLVCYAIPRTAVVGAVLLTGYFGGVIATHLRVSSPADSFIFILVLAALVWGGLALRDRRVLTILGAER